MFASTAVALEAQALPLQAFEPNDRKAIENVYKAAQEINALLSSRRFDPFELKQRLDTYARMGLMEEAKAFGKRSAYDQNPGLRRAIHDLRGFAFTVFLGRLAMLRMAPGSPRQQAACAQAAENCVERIRRLIQDMA